MEDKDKIFMDGRFNDHYSRIYTKEFYKKKVLSKLKTNGLKIKIEGKDPYDTNSVKYSPS